MPLICQSRWWLLNDRHCMAETASHRAVTVQSQGPSQLNSLSVSLHPHFKRWHIKELLLLDCIHLYTHTHKVDHTRRATCTLTQRRHSRKYCTYVDAHTHTQNILQCSFLGWMCWQMTLFNTVSSALCFASTAMGHSQMQGEEEEKRDTKRAKERERGK